MSAAALAHSRAETMSKMAWGAVCVLGAALVAHAVGVGLDFIAAFHWRPQLDYGEGIVWQQARLMDTARAYATSPDLPFVVFHYPPLYHLAVRTMVWLVPDWLSAGRLVSMLATVSLAPLVASLVLAGAGSSSPGPVSRDLLMAGLAGLLVLCVPAIRTWGMVMRVDALALALALAGTLVASRRLDRPGGLICALLLCTAAVFTKQSQISAGVAVVFVAFVRAPRQAVVSVLVVAALAGCVLALLQWRTGGGFLLHVISYNVNRFAFAQLCAVLAAQRPSFLLMALIVVAALLLLRGNSSGGLHRAREGWLARRVALCRSDPAYACRAIVLLHFAMATALLPSMAKVGSNMNYLLEWLAVGCVLLGFVLVGAGRDAQRGFGLVAPACALLAVGVALTPLRVLADAPEAADALAADDLVRRIARAGKPVASDDMSLLLRAGKQVVYEPAIATELALVGRWDERPLVRMIRAGGFAFMITADNELGPDVHHTAGINGAMQAAYPRIESAGAGLWLHLPE